MNVAEFASKTLTNLRKQDLRTWLGQMKAADELQFIKGANREEEIGGIVDVYQRQSGNRAVLDRSRIGRIAKSTMR